MAERIGVACSGEDTEKMEHRVALRDRRTTEEKIEWQSVSRQSRRRPNRSSLLYHQLILCVKHLKSHESNPKFWDDPFHGLWSMVPFIVRTLPGTRRESSPWGGER